MDLFEQKLRDTLKSEANLLFSAELQQKIIQKARRQERKKRLRIFTVGTASIVAAAAAVTLYVSQPSDKITKPLVQQGMVNKVGTPAVMQSIHKLNLSWQKAPIVVEQIQSDGRTVFAQIRNTGTQALTNDEIQGILLFHPQKVTDQNSDTWYYFVDGPNTPVKPGDSATWEFRPTPVPSTSGKIDRTPDLLFVYRGQFNKDSHARLLLKQPPISEQVLSVGSTGPQKEYLDVTIRVDNNGPKPFDPKQFMALVFFPKSAFDDELNPFTYKYFADLTPEKEKTIDPGQSGFLHLFVIAPPGVDLIGREVRVDVVDKQLQLDK